jgi:hypothetical protein
VTTELPSGTTAPPRRRAIEHPGRFAIVAGGLTLVALLFAGAITSADTSDPRDEEQLPTEVTSVSPREGAIVPPQTPITVDLRDDLTADLSLCGPTQSTGGCTPLPADQVEFVKALGQLTFRPGDGQDIEAWEPGRNQVIVNHYSQADPEADRGSFSWTFVSKS